MKVIIDTSVWSLALRRSEQNNIPENAIWINELKELINENRVVLIGPIRQELLSGISDQNKFNVLKSRLSVFDDFPIHTENYDDAAYFFNLCRSKGIQGSHIDFLICSVASSQNMSIFTNDRDFIKFSEILPIRLHQPRNLTNK
jgi:predicted nucleic acid-binding protein